MKKVYGIGVTAYEKSEVMSEAVTAIWQLRRERYAKNRKRILKSYSKNEVFVQTLRIILDPNIMRFNRKKLIRFLDITLPCQQERKEEVRWLEMIRWIIHNQYDCEFGYHRAAKLINTYKRNREFYILVLTGMFKLNCDINEVHKVLPGVVPDYRIQKIPYIRKAWLPVKGEWFSLTPVKNGIQATYADGVFYDANNVVIPRLFHLATAIQKAGLEQYIIRGMLYMNPVDGLAWDENQALLEYITKSNKKDKRRIMFSIHDMIHRDEYISNNLKTEYMERFLEMNKAMNRIKESKIKYLSIVQTSYYGASDNPNDIISKHLDEAMDNGYDGLVIKRDGIWEKEFTGLTSLITPVWESWLLCNGIEFHDTSKKRIKGIYVKYAKDNILIEHGFTDRQKVEFRRDPDSIVGKYIRIRSVPNRDRLLLFPYFYSIAAKVTSERLRFKVNVER